MSRLAISITGQPLYATGDVRLWVDVTLSIRDGAGSFVDTDFRVDTGTEITTFPAYEAKQLGLFVSARPANVRHDQTGQEVRSGMLAFRIVGLDQALYALPCLLLGDPDTPPDPNNRATFPRTLLQPFHLLDALKFIMDKDPASIGAQHGVFVIEKR